MSDVGEAERLVEPIGDAATFYKVGMELAYAEDGLAFASRLAAAGGQVFLDLKLHDIPNTVERATAQAASSARVPHHSRLSANDARRGRGREGLGARVCSRSRS